MVTMLSLLIAEAMDTVDGVKERVNIDGLKTIYHLLWDNPNPTKRKQFRAKMNDLKEEDAWGGAQRALKHLDEMANLIGIQLIEGVGDVSSAALCAGSACVSY